MMNEASLSRNYNLVCVDAWIPYGTLSPEGAVDYALMRSQRGIKEMYDRAAWSNKRCPHDHVVELNYQHDRGVSTVLVSATQPREFAVKRLKRAILNLSVV